MVRYKIVGSAVELDERERNPASSSVRHRLGDSHRPDHGAVIRATGRGETLSFVDSGRSQSDGTFRKKLPSLVHN